MSLATIIVLIVAATLFFSSPLATYIVGKIGAVIWSIATFLFVTITIAVAAYFMPHPNDFLSWVGFCTFFLSWPPFVIIANMKQYKRYNQYRRY